MPRINIAGAGLSGLSAALTLAYQGIGCNLISQKPSERAQSVLAEGGINAALDTMGENDAPSFHYEDTMKGGVFLADPEAVRGLTEAAPGIVRKLQSLGVPFQMAEGDLVLRPFGGQKKRRTAYAMSSTGKVIMTALIDEVRKYEAAGLIRRFSHMEIERVLVENGSAAGLACRDCYTDQRYRFEGPVILCTGGLNGMFPGMTTGTTANTGDLAAALFIDGVKMGNLEMIQYHPTTAAICGKRLLISEAARGEGGRLFVRRKKQDAVEEWYFMEEKYPELKNLMPRDVVSREMYMVVKNPDCENQVYLDMRHLKKETWDTKLSDLRREIIHYLKLDPASEPVPVSPGIHFFMGGVLADIHHRTNLPGLWAAGECACQYHGANRLGGNSMLAALYGGSVAAADAAKQYPDPDGGKAPGNGEGVFPGAEVDGTEQNEEARISPPFTEKLTRVLKDCLGIYRDEKTLRKGLADLEELEKNGISSAEFRRLSLARAMLLSALERRESRGAHTRTDYPERDDVHYQKTTCARYADGNIQISFERTGRNEQYAIRSR